MMSAALKSSYLRRMGLVAVGAAVLALVMTAPGVRAQDVNSAESSSTAGGTNAVTPIDALDLEPMIQLRGNPGTSYSIKGTSYTVQWPTDASNGPGGGGAGYPGRMGPESGYPGATGRSEPSLPFSYISGSMDAVHNTPAPDLLLFAFRPSIPDPDPSNVQPVIERLWAGLGGHHFVTQASHGTFPVICRIRGGDRSFRGSLEVSQDKSFVWSAPVVLDPGQETTVEVDAGGSGESVPQTEEWKVALRSNGPGPAIDTRTFHMGASYAQVYLITPSIAGHNTTDEALCVAPDYVNRGHGVDASAIFPRVEAISPALLPDTAAGWDSAREVVVPRDMAPLLSSQVRAALMAWTADGGYLVVYPGSGLAPSGAGTTSSSFTSGSVTVGSGKIEFRPERGANLGRPSVTSFISGILLPYPDRSAQSNLPHPYYEDGIGYLQPRGARPSLQGAPSTPAPSITMPRWPVFLIFGLLYAAILGPLSLWLMRRVRRIVMVWLVVPLTASFLTIVILALSGTWTHALRTVNVTTNAAIAAGASDGFAESQVWVFSPEGGNFTLAADGQMIQPSEFDLSGGGDGVDSGTVSDYLSRGQHTVGIENLPNFGMRELNLGGAIHLNGSLGISLHPDGSGVLINATDKPVPPSWLATANSTRSIPVIDAGRRYHFSAAGWSRKPPEAPASATHASDATGYAGAADSSPGAVRLYVPAVLLSNHDLSEVEWGIPGSPWGVIAASPRSTGVRNCFLTVTAPAPRPFLEH